MKKRRIILSILSLVFLILIVTACDNFSLYSQLDGGENAMQITGGGGNVQTNTLIITPASAVITTNSTYTFSASGGTGPYTFSVIDGIGTIEASTGVYHSPSTAGSATVRVSDAAGDSQNAEISIIIPGTFTISPSTVVVYANTSTTFSATGGSPPYVFSIPAGSGNVVPATGVYTAPSAAGTDTVRVTDSTSATSDATVTVLESLRISPAAVTLAPGGTETFSASGGLSPYAFSMHSGSGSINPSTGDYTAPGGAGTDRVKVTDDLGNTVIATVTIAAPSPVSISPVNIEVYVNTKTTFSANGGTSPYTFSVLGSGSVAPATGVYTAPATTGTDTVRVTDDDSNTSDATVTVLEHLRISPSTATVSTGGGATFSASGGKAPYTFSIHSGSGSINPSTGVYTAPGSAGSDEVKVTDDSGNFDIAAVTITAPAPLQISPTSVTVSTGNSTSFSANGGTSPYTFSVYSGAGSINGTTGVYTAPGSAGTEIVRVTDNAGDTRDATVTVTSTGLLSISPASAVIEQNTTFDFSADGGTPPYNFSVLGPGSINASSGLFTAPSTLGASTVRVTDSSNATSDATVDIAPAAPTNLDANGSFGTPQDLRLTWTDNAAGESGFKIERSVNGGAFVNLDTVGENITVYDDDDCNPNNWYGYRVRAYNGSVHSAYSNESHDLSN